MSPTAKMPDWSVLKVSVSTFSCLRSSGSPHSAMGPSLGDRPCSTSSWSHAAGEVVPSLCSISMACIVSPCICNAVSLSGHKMQCTGAEQFAKPGHQRCVCSKHIAPVQHADAGLLREGQTLIFYRQVHCRTQGQIAISQNEHLLAGISGVRVEGVMDLSAFQDRCAFQLQGSGLERAYASRNENGFGKKCRFAFGSGCWRLAGCAPKICHRLALPGC